MSGLPGGTRAWRKGWRKRWREGSSFSALHPVAKLTVMWIEENADDEGHLTGTERYIAARLSGARRQASVPRMAVWRALRELQAAGLIRIELGQVPGRELGQKVMHITRLNFREYQEEVDPVGPPVGPASRIELGLSSRGTSRGKTLSALTAVQPINGKPPPPDPVRRELSDALVAVGREERNGTFAFDGAKDGQALGRLLKWSHDVGEHARRFRLALRSPAVNYGFHVDTISAFATGRIWNHFANGVEQRSLVPPTDLIVRPTYT